MQKENALRKIVKGLIASSRYTQLAVSWVESHYTSPGIPDLNYCCNGIEGWLELKAGPDLEVRASQVIWMEDRVSAGGFPLFLIKWGDVFMVVPGSEAQSIRSNPSRENIMCRASTVWNDKIATEDFFTLLEHPENEYDKNDERSAAGKRC